MTYPEKINWLRQYRAAVRREQLLEGELEAMRSAAVRMTACLTGMPGAGPDPDRLPRAVERIENTRKKLEQQIEECVERRRCRRPTCRKCCAAATFWAKAMPRSPTR